MWHDSRHIWKEQERRNMDIMWLTNFESVFNLKNKFFVWIKKNLIIETI